MTGKEFADYIRYNTRTNTTTFPNSDILLLANIKREELSRVIIDAHEDIFLVPQTTDLIAGERLYPFPNDILARIKRIEASFDGTNWTRLVEVDLNDYKMATNETSILGFFSNQEGGAKYELGRKAIRLFCGTIIDVEEGLKLWCSTWPSKLQTYQFDDALIDLSHDPTPTTHGFPPEFHELWARSVSIAYKTSREKPIPLNDSELKFEVDLQKALITLRHGNEDRDVISHIPPASDRGNNGYNY